MLKFTEETESSTNTEKTKRILRILENFITLIFPPTHHSKMNLQDEPNDKLNGSLPPEDANKEESCILIEENISTVDLANDTITETKDTEVRDRSTVDDTTDETGVIEDTLPSEFQVIDEIGSQENEEDGSGEEVAEVETNGVS